MANKNLYVHNGLTVGSSVEINGTSGNVLTSGIVTTTNTTNASSTVTGALQVRGGAGIGGNLYVGGTIFGNIDATVSSATTIATTARTTNAAHYLTFVDSNNSTAAYESVYTTSSFSVNPSTGNVGIGTTSPARSLEVNGSIRIANSGALEWGGLTTAIVGSGSTNIIQFYTTSTERMRIGANGNVGIGTSSPFGKLHLQDTVANLEMFMLGPVGGSARIRFGDTDDSNIGQIIYDNTSDSMQFHANNAERMRIDSNGNVLVGKTVADDSTIGVRLSRFGFVSASRNDNPGIILNRTNSNGDIALFRREGSNVGSISVTTTATSYNISSTSGITGVDANTVAIRTSSAERMRITAAGDVGIGTNSPTYKLEVNGSFAAVTKSFVINHPTKPGMKLRYGSLEGPENGVYVRGRLKGSNKIELPDYWTGLVDEETITVNLTPIGKHQKLYVEDIADNIVIVGNDNLLNKEINCFYTVFAERKDVDKLDVEI